jgi:hypothetical protein
MMRIVAVSVFAALLAACSGSNRVEDIVPAWANTPHPATQYTARRNRSEDHGPVAAEPKPAAAPQQEAKKPESQNASEE